jgi:transglutaminase-like putative cysteine protease
MFGDRAGSRDRRAGARTAARFRSARSVKIRVGYEISYDCPKPTPMLLVLSVHPSRRADFLTPARIVFDPPIHSTDYHDGFGNICTRILAPAGTLTISSDQIVADPGTADIVAPDAEQHAVEELPEDTLVFLLGSRYCETDRLSDAAWSLFGTVPPGWQRVQSICDFVYGHIQFGYEHARPTKSAWDAYMERNGVCRDFAHLAVALCRCMNIPARYCTGYLGDIGVPLSDAPMDFSAWFEAYLGNRWYTFDARHNRPRIGRIVMARGRDATDVAISTTFGPCVLTGFTVVADELPGAG